jgi:hypothetical protein
VHSLEHRAVWITYRPGLPADQLDALTTLVNGNFIDLLRHDPRRTPEVGVTCSNPTLKRSLSRPGQPIDA